MTARANRAVEDGIQSRADPDVAGNMVTTAEAQPNIALIKYWGKQNTERNLPAVSSVSITLAGLRARTEVAMRPEAIQDSLAINGQHDAAGERRAQRCLSQLRATTDRRLAKLAVNSDVNFPVAAGLASSAAGFAALVVAADAEYEMRSDRQQLARLAGRASGSAARSLYGGFVRLLAPKNGDDDIVVETLGDSQHWPLSVVIAITDTAPKPLSSTEAMTRTRETSPYYRSWVDNQDGDIKTASSAVADRDFDKLATVSEANCLKMHALMMSAAPGIIYWNAATVELIRVVRDLRKNGCAVFFTIDAGPQVKAVCLPEDGVTVSEALASVTGVVSTDTVGLGSGAKVVS